MRYFRYFVSSLILALSGHAHALDASAHVVKSASNTNVLICPSQHSPAFLTVFNKSARECVSKNWLEAMFPEPENCTPRSFYYDKTVSSSAEKVMEKMGYEAYSINEQLAKYKIDEPFYGLVATHLSIPSETDSIYAVTVSSNAKTLVKNIKARTGANLWIYKEGMKPKSGVAYIVPDSRTTSTFVCFTFEE